jgi:hypothetical protein
MTMTHQVQEGGTGRAEGDGFRDLEASWGGTGGGKGGGGREEEGQEEGQGGRQLPGPGS